jgi:LmbE family N-acetylglucosaminyl deacetylase
MRLFVAYAHPDDESFGPAAVLADARAAGADLYGLWFTRGEHGQPVANPPPDPTTLAAQRERDLREAAGLIGFQTFELLDYEDGSLEGYGDAVTAHVLARLRRLRPEIVLTFGPGGITRHPDHVAVHRAATAAFHQALAEGLPLRALYYDAVPTAVARRSGIETELDGRPNAWVAVSEPARKAKLAALAVHARHVTDARRRLALLEREPLRLEPLHRAWPPVPARTTLDRLLSASDA